MLVIKIKYSLGKVRNWIARRLRLKGKNGKNPSRYPPLYWGASLQMSLNVFGKTQCNDEPKSGDLPYLRHFSKTYGPIGGSAD